jgi:6-phosphofructokinase 1
MLDGRLNRGGSIIKSSRSPRFLKENYFKLALNNISAHKIDALIIIGGYGSIKGAMKLRENGIKIITLPATIDNDLNFSYTIGFDTATNNIVNAMDNINDCLSSFNYGSVVKIMGRDCTDLIDCVAQSIHSTFVIKTKNFNLNTLVKNIKQAKLTSHLPIVVLVLEDIINCDELASTLQEKCKMQFRSHILGYIQRGGTPSAYDRKYGYSAGISAVESILRGETGFTIGMEKDILIKKSFEDTVKKF